MTPKIIINAFLLIVLTSCSSSMVYSPSINLPNEILKKNEFDFHGGFEAMPETRPEKLSGGDQTTLGIHGQVGYGYNDKFNMSIKGWMDLGDRENEIRYGISLNSQFVKAINDKKKIIVLPRVGASFGGIGIGYGLSNSFIFHHAINQKVGYYAGVGGAWGYESLHNQTNDNGERKVPMGFGILGNFGLSWEIQSGIRLNFEVSPIYQINTFDDVDQFIFSPQIGVGYKLWLKDN